MSDTNNSAPENPRRRSRWLQLRLGTLLLLVTLCCTALGFRQAYLVPYRLQREALEKLLEQSPGASVEMRPGKPEWLRHFVGAKDFHDVVVLHMEHKRMRDGDLPRLRGLRMLEYLYLAGNPITNRGVRNLLLLKRVRRLSLWRTLITDDGLQYLERMNHLRALDIHATRVTDDGLKHVAKLPDLEELTLGHQITDAGMRHLSGLRNLKTVDIRRCRGVTASGLAHLEKTGVEHVAADPSIFDRESIKTLALLKELQSIELNSDTLRNRDLEHLASLKNLKTLNIASANLSDRGMEVLARLPMLEHLDIRARISGAGLRTLAGIKSLKTLAVSSPVLTDKDILDPELKFASRPYSLAITSPWISVGGQALSRALPNATITVSRGPNRVNTQVIDLNQRHARAEDVRLHRSPDAVRQLFLRETTIGDLDSLSAIPNLKNLSIVNLVSGRRGLSDDDLAKISKLKNLEYLEIHSRFITDAGVEHLKRLTNLRSLVIRSAWVTAKKRNELRATMRGVRVGTQRTYVSVVGDEVRSLSLNSVRISPFDMEQLAKCKQIQTAIFSGSTVTDEQVKTIGELTSLRNLHLQDTRITGRALAHLKSLQDLQLLRLDGSLVDDRHFEVLGGLPNLRQLFIGSTRVTDHGLRALAASRSIDLLDFSGKYDSMTAGMLTGQGLDALKDVPLHQLMADLTRFDDTAAKSLPHFGELRRLSLNRTEVTDAAIEHIRKLDKLSVLAIGHTRITLMGIKKLAGHGRLRYITTDQRMVDDKAHAQLRKLMPKVRIQRLY